jgi:hypothetical protein
LVRPATRHSFLFFKPAFFKQMASIFPISQ